MRVAGRFPNRAFCRDREIIRMWFSLSDEMI